MSVQTRRSRIEQRKQDHLDVNLHHDVTAPGTTSGLEAFRLRHRALPECDFAAVDPATTVLGKRLRLPVLISSMTGGVEQGGDINRRLATAAQATGCAMAVGSQRAALELAGLAATYRVRDVAPDILLLANLGAVQLNRGYGIEECRRAVDMIGADALILHLNPIQEALQPGGDHDFSRLAARIADICATLEVPVVVKEIGFGMSPDDVRLLAAAGVAAIDIAGAGGTSWSAVEAVLAPNDRLQRLGQTFAEWGIPTASSLIMAREANSAIPLIASGGLRTGLDAAKAFALGASLAGFAGPVLRAAAESTAAAIELLETVGAEIRLAMFGCGVTRLGQLDTSHLLVRDCHDLWTSYRA